VSDDRDPDAQLDSTARVRTAGEAESQPPGPFAPAEQADTPELVQAQGAEDVDRELRRLSRRGFLTLAAGAAGVALGWRWLLKQPRDSGIPGPFRQSLEANATLWQALASPERLAPVYPAAAAVARPRINGKLGLDEAADPSTWSLKIEGAASGPLTLPLAAILELPRQQLTTELRCVEGWSMIVTWTGARLADFIAAYPPAMRDGSRPNPARPDLLPRFVGLETPGRGYYVGLDLASALHPQTLLAYEINGRPLSWEHGAPLRLAIPIKYGVKSLKRIGTLRYTDVRPADYWAERGYDWYLGH
jgi:DMSO/TMAO reductase YedYZ molybdopterin-dependent catalytic subunit